MAKWLKAKQCVAVSLVLQASLMSSFSYADSSAIQKKIAQIEKKEESTEKDKAANNKLILDIKVKMRVLEARLKKIPKEESAAKRKELDALEAQLDAAQIDNSFFKEELDALVDKKERLEKKFEIAQEKESKKTEVTGCPDGNCRQRVIPGFQNSQHHSPSGLELVADVAKTAIPSLVQLGLGVYGINQQSKDYKLYNSNNTELGLPSTAPTGYSSLLGSLYGINNMSANTMGMNMYSGMNMGMNQGMNMGMNMSNYSSGYNNYGMNFGLNMYGSYNPYASQYSGLNMYSGYNPYSSMMMGYSTSNPYMYGTNLQYGMNTNLVYTGNNGNYTNSYANTNSLLNVPVLQNNRQ